MSALRQPAACLQQLAFSSLSWSKQLTFYSKRWAKLVTFRCLPWAKLLTFLCLSDLSQAAYIFDVCIGLNSLPSAVCPKPSCLLYDVCIGLNSLPSLPYTALLLHSISDQVENIQNCLTTPRHKTIVGGGASDNTQLCCKVRFYVTFKTKRFCIAFYKSYAFSGPHYRSSLVSLTRLDSKPPCWSN